MHIISCVCSAHPAEHALFLALRVNATEAPAYTVNQRGTRRGCGRLQCDKCGCLQSLHRCKRSSSRTHMPPSDPQRTGIRCRIPLLTTTASAWLALWAHLNAGVAITDITAAPPLILAPPAAGFSLAVGRALADCSESPSWLCQASLTMPHSAACSNDEAFDSLTASLGIARGVVLVLPASVVPWVATGLHQASGLGCTLCWIVSQWAACVTSAARILPAAADAKQRRRNW